MVALLVAAIFQCISGRPFQIGEVIARKFVQARYAACAHLTFQVLQILQEPGIASRFEQIRDGCDRPGAGRQESSYVERVRAASV